MQESRGRETARQEIYDGNTFAALGDFRFDLYDGNLMEMGMQWDGLEIWHYIRHRIKNRIWNRTAALKGFEGGLELDDGMASLLFLLFVCEVITR